MIIRMSKHQYAKEVLFEAIGSKVGIYDKYSRYVKDEVQGRQNGGTHLVKSISNAWDDIAKDELFNGVEWQRIILENDNSGLRLKRISSVISFYFFGPANTDGLTLLIEDGVKQARATLKYESHLS